MRSESDYRTCVLDKHSSFGGRFLVGAVVMQGIYKIENKSNGKRYIGSTNNIQKRWREHRSLLKRGGHFNDHLQKSWDKYGSGSFSFDIIFVVDSEEDLFLYEQWYLDVLKPEYNMAKAADNPMRGVAMSEEHKRKISKARIGKYSGKDSPVWGTKLSPERKKKISMANRGEKCSGSKLTKEDVVSLRERAKDNNPVDVENLANLYDVSLSTIKRAIVGATWKHLPGAVPNFNRSIIESRKKERMRRKAQINALKRSSLTSKDIIAIREEYKTSDVTQAGLARKYNTRSELVCRIVNKVRFEFVTKEWIDDTEDVL